MPNNQNKQIYWRVVMSNAIRIESIEQFVEQISKLELSKNHTRFFRGHSDKKYLLEPSIYRKNKDTGKQELIKSEHLITKDVLTECAEYFSPHDTLFDKLVKMQHYDYPTRLLDISYNALVGLYFAVNNNYGKDKKTVNCQECNQENIINDDLKNGEVIIFDIPSSQIKYHDSDTVAILSALSLQNNDFDIELYQKISQENLLNNLDILRRNMEKNPNFLLDNTLIPERLSKEVDDEVHQRNCLSFNNSLFNAINNELNKIQEIINLLNDIRKDKPYFLSNIDYRDFYKVICVKPRLNNPRIAKQQGAFLIFGIQSNKTSQANVNPEWVRARFIIDASKKEYILKQLEYCGINHQTLFPELDKQATHIIDRYKDI